MYLEILAYLNRRYRKFPLDFQINRTLQNAVAPKCYINDTPSLCTCSIIQFLEERHGLNKKVYLVKMIIEEISSKFQLKVLIASKFQMNINVNRIFAYACNQHFNIY